MGQDSSRKISHAKAQRRKEESGALRLLRAFASLRENQFLSEIRATSRAALRSERNRRQTQRTVFRVWRRWRSSTQAIDGLHDQEHHQRDDQKVDDVIDQLTVRNHRQ